MSELSVTLHWQRSEPAFRPGELSLDRFSDGFSVASVAIKRNEIPDTGDWLEGLLVAPSRVVCERVAHTERPAGGVSLVRSVRRMVRATQ